MTAKGLPFAVTRRNCVPAFFLARYATGATKRSKELFMQEMQARHNLNGKAIAGLLKDYEGNVDWLNNDSIAAFASFIEEQVNG